MGGGTDLMLERSRRKSGVPEGRIRPTEVKSSLILLGWHQSPREVDQAGFGRTTGPASQEDPRKLRDIQSQL